jgi:CRP-like cAMP-binding protein
MNENKALQDIIRNNRNIKLEVFVKDDILFSEGEKPKGIYCIETGNVKLSKKSNNGQQRLMYLATNGEILGLHPVVNNHPYASTASALSDVHTVFISSENFMSLIKSNNTYKLLVMKSLCSRIDSMEEHVAGLSEKTSDERFADALLMLINKYGMNSSNTLNVHLTLEELASFTCTSKSYMKKIVSDFSSKGLVSISADNIKILNLPKIKNIADQV